MDTDAIGTALKRKLGPLPVWIWAIFGGVVVYYLRKRGYFGGVLGSDQGTALQPSQTNATPPQSQVPLQPGESVYDPNTGALTTAPSGDTGGTGTGIDPSQAIDDLASAIAGGFTTTVRVNSATPRKPVKSPGKHARLKPTTKRRAKKKAAHHQEPHKTTATAKHKKRPRGSSAVRAVTGGRQNAVHSAPKTKSVQSRAITTTVTSTVRQRPTSGITRTTTPLQHPVSSHATRGTKTSAPPPRPSAPASRAIRSAPAKKTTPPSRNRRK